MKKLLLHTCCGPCFIYPHSVLKDQYNIEAYYFNPNIQPSLEYARRLETFAAYASAQGVPFHVGEYNPRIHLHAIAGAEDDRCRICYSIRLTEAARFAAARGFDVFSTTLSVSPYQNHDVLRSVGEAAGAEHDIEFRYVDFRTGFSAAQARAKELEMYRQAYCGCIYSEIERNDKKLKRAVEEARSKGHDPGADR